MGLPRRDILPRIPLQSDGPMAHVELLAKANYLGCVLGEEVPFAIEPGPYCGDAGAIYREAKRVFDGGASGGTGGREILT